jgi:quercetin dioxygenase-like cupin family protein
VEEVFFMLRGSIRLTIEDGDRKWETVLKERDLMSVPPGVYRELINEGEEEALMCVMLGATKPVTPTYPADHPLSSIER